MSAPTTPAVASPSSNPPPVANFAFVDSGGKLTPAGLNFLQLMWSGVFGTGGVTEIINNTTIIQSINPIVGGQIESLIASDALRKSHQPFWRTDSASLIGWTPTIAGASTAGTQTYTTQWGGFAFIGPMIAALFSVTLSALGGTTAGNVLISGLPFAANAGAGAQGGWLGTWSNCTLSAGYTSLGVEIAAAGTSFHVIAAGSTKAAANLDAVAGLSATSSFVGGALYFP